MKSAFSLSTILALASTAIATDWHFLTWEPASGEQFIGFSGDMVVPDLPEAATYYVWPGLQPTDNSGVYQNVLDGRSGTWWFGSGWCCSSKHFALVVDRSDIWLTFSCEDPSLPWGDGFNTNKGDIISFKNIQTSGTNWTSTVSQKGDSSLRASNKFALSKSNLCLSLRLPSPLKSIKIAFGRADVRHRRLQELQPSDPRHRARRPHLDVWLRRLQEFVDHQHRHGHLVV